MALFPGFYGFHSRLKNFKKTEQCFWTTLHSISILQKLSLAHGLLEVIHLVVCYCKHYDYIHGLAFMSKERQASYRRTVKIYCLVTHGHANAHTCYTQIPNHNELPVHPWPVVSSLAPSPGN